MEWHTVSKLSPRKEETAEGYLVCRDVPIARTGTQIYWENEVPPLQGDAGGRVHVDREATEVFHPDSVRSFEGKPLVDNHPYEPVGPDNWADLTIGYVANVRRGEGVHDDLLLADLVFTTRRGIDAVTRGKRAISVGYNAYYEQTAPGLGRQKNIFCNHVALVDEGRCGARCTIMDGKTIYDYDGIDAASRDDAGFDPSKHPHAPGGTSEGGQFTSAGGGGGGGGGGSSKSRAESILEELNAKGAPDSEYKAAFSTGSKTALKKGETWKGKLESWVASEKPGAAKPASKAEPKAAAPQGEIGKRTAATANHLTAKEKDGKRVGADGKALPEHVQAAKIPPAWKDVTYNPDPKAALIATGVDGKGNRQPIYSAEHHAGKGAEKFARIKALAGKIDAIQKDNEAARKSGNQKKVDSADATSLIMATGIRPGSLKDTGADEQSYGAVTLEARHVVKTKDGVILRFVPGKKHGQTIEMPVNDPAVAKMLLDRKEKSKSGDRLFNVGAGDLLKHVHSLGDGSFKTKDFRTHLGTKTAMEAMKSMPVPANEKEYKAAVKKVATLVSDKLGNTPAVALQSYISPVIWSTWQAKAGVSQDAALDEDDDGLPDAHWGEYDAPLPDYRDAEDDTNAGGDDDVEGDDDELLAETPEDVIAMIGFDPRELEDEETEDAPRAVRKGGVRLYDYRNGVMRMMTFGMRATPTHDAACSCDVCNPRKEPPMAGLRELLGRAFVARDKGDLEKLIVEASKGTKGAFTHDNDPEHDEPDGDEGKQAIVIHNHHNEAGNGNGTSDADKDDDDDDWKKNTDAALKDLRDAVKAISDKLTARDEFPPKKDDDDDKDTKDQDGDKDDDKDKDTKDIDPGEEAQTGSPPPSAEPDLMEADPALKMGPSMMGDATFNSRVNQAMNHLVRDTKARAEVLSPGIKIGVLDGAAGKDRMKQAGIRICNIRRQALTAAAGNERGMVAVGRHTKDAIAAMSCDAVKMLFVDASDRMRQMNNAQNVPSPHFGDMRRTANASLREKIEAINKRNAEQWAAWGGTGRRAS